jgi:integrase
MARPARPLTDKIIRDAMRGAGKRSFPLYDGHGLHLIDRGGRYHWRLKYARPDGRENRLALGHFPEVSLSEARALANAARAKLRQGIDPAGEKKAARAAREAATERTFAIFGRKWLELKTPGWSPITARKNKRAVEAYLLPKLGEKDVATIATADVLPVIREANGKSPEFARAAAGAAQSIVRLAIAEGAREEGRLLDLDLRHNLPGRDRGHNPAATTPAGISSVMQAIRKVENPVTRAALLMCAYSAQRPANVVGMRWDDVDTKAKEWTLPAAVMKMRHAHIVPLPRQALALLKMLRPFTGGRGYVFPPVRQQHTPHLHRDSLSNALRDAGLRGKQTPHGFRATFRTVARERLNVSADVLEAQLAHAKKDEVQAAYDRTGFVTERHKVMQEWADYLDE